MAVDTQPVGVVGRAVGGDTGVEQQAGGGRAAPHRHERGATLLGRRPMIRRAPASPATIEPERGFRPPPGVDREERALRLANAPPPYRCGPQPHRMRAVQITRFGGPGVLDVVDLPDPTPAEGQERYDVSSSGVNYAVIHHSCRERYMSGRLARGARTWMH